MTNFLREKTQTSLAMVKSTLKSLMTISLNSQRNRSKYLMTASFLIPKPNHKRITVFYLYSDLKRTSSKLAIPFPYKTHTLKDLRRDIAIMAGCAPDSFQLAFLSKSSKEIIIEDEAGYLTNTFRKKNIADNLFAIDLTPHRLEHDITGIYIDFRLTRSSGGTNPIRVTFTLLRTICFPLNYTLRQVYLRVFTAIRFLYDEYLPEQWLGLSDEEAFQQIYEKKQPDQKHFKIFLVTNAGECIFCEKSSCYGCELECSNESKLNEHVVSKLKGRGGPQMELCFENIPDVIDLNRFNGYMNVSRKIKEE